MSENHPPRPPYLESTSDNPETELAQFKYDWAVPGYTQAAPLGIAPNTDRFPGREDPPGSYPGDRVSINPKVPIPRTTQPSHWTSSGRVSRACENCREQKAKCSGHRPACHRCQDAGIQCSYGDRKREKMLKQLSDLNTQVQTYEAVLRELYPRLDASSAHESESDAVFTPSKLDFCPFGLLTSFVTKNRAPNNDQPPNSSVPKPDPGDSSTYPLATVDHTKEDYNRDEKVQALGFMGEHSEMVWLYRLKRDLDQDSLTPVNEQPDRPSISSLNYFQDDTEISNPENVDITSRPSQVVADKLVDDYFQVVHPSFPIIGKGIFLGQYRSFYSNPTVRPGRRWMAVLNLVFAIAAKHSLLTASQSRGDYGDHLDYFARAWRLSVDNVLLDHPNLQQVQVEGLAAFYLLSTGQVNRSWRIIGIAIRSAVAMGLNLRSESDSIAHVSKETRYRVWWALFMLDTVLCVTTGRPPSTGEVFCTTPLPVPYREEDFWDERVIQLVTDQDLRNGLMASLLSRDAVSQLSQASSEHTDSATFTPGKATSNEQNLHAMLTALAPNISLYFLYAVDLAFLMREAIEILYAPKAMRRSWLEMDMAISAFNNTADNWLSRLPATFHFVGLDPEQQFGRQRASLGFRFYTTKLVILQPCLRRLAYHPPSTGSWTVCEAMAALCVQAARDMLALLPDETDASWLYGISPWWCVLHYVMQSTTVLLVELFTRAQPGTNGAATLAAEVSKAIGWLREMSTRDPSARQAWLVCANIISRHGLKFGLQVDAGL
ncbi:uncharacterized protein N7459_005270 [Penicillium hispanicum]|uniref:uncharacterized protein n=1 Tax=Penicillium hispanicum TaxID=1080232 RepID=UPI002542689A|nr:uncharacterized protein N7459_005270 [Penicillium hispanicum]KAJ5585470.1 hypothetical protein N7459_005270 [Penicillium hispanicum]